MGRRSIDVLSQFVEVMGNVIRIKMAYKMYNFVVTKLSEQNDKTTDFIIFVCYTMQLSTALRELRLWEKFCSHYTTSHKVECDNIRTGAVFS